MDERLYAILMIVLKVVLIFVVGLLLIKIILIIERKALRRSKVDASLYLFLVRGTKALLLIILIIMALQSVGVSTASMIAVVSAGGAAIALAFKDSLSNVTAGVLLMINHPFQQGEEISLPGEDLRGTVIGIDLMTTKLRTFDEEVVSVPNNTMVGSVIINSTQSGIRRLSREITIGYEDDVKLASQIIKRIAQEHPLALADPAPAVGVIRYDAYGITLQMKVWAKPENYYTLEYAMMEKLKRAFDEAGITIPFPRTDVHVTQETETR